MQEQHKSNFWSKLPRIQVLPSKAETIGGIKYVCDSNIILGQEAVIDLLESFADAS